MADLPILRPNQEKAMSEVSALYRAGTKRVLLQASVAFGKSTTASFMLSKTRMRTLVLAPRIEIVNQISRAVAVPHGLLMPGRVETTHPIQIGMVPTAVRRLDHLPDFDWIISDEAHWSAAEGWRRIFERYKDKFHLGMSATPCRLDNRPLADNFDAMVHGPSTQDMVDAGYLVPARLFAPPIELGKIGKKGGEYDAAQVEDTLGKRQLIGDTIDQWRKHAAGRKTIVFCCSRAHAEAVAQQFTMCGIKAIMIDGTLDKAERRRRFDAFETGDTQILCNVDIATTGYDYPPLSCVIWLRKTASTALWLQGNGRGARISPGKADYVILDHANNASDHGHPHEPREWSLVGKPKRPGVAPHRQCPECFAVVALGPTCSACGFEFEAVLTREMEVVGGDLHEIESDELYRLRTGNFHETVAQARTMEDLVKIAKARNFKPGWAHNVMQSRIARKAQYRKGA